MFTGVATFFGMIVVTVITVITVVTVLWCYICLMVVGMALLWLIITMLPWLIVIMPFAHITKS
jgi:hypothetical protein